MGGEQDFDLLPGIGCSSRLFRMTFDVYTPRAHLVFLPKGEWRNRWRDFDSLDEKSVKHLIDTARRVVERFHLQSPENQPILSIHRGSFVTMRKVFHCHLCISVDSYLAIFERRKHEFPEWPSRKYVTRQWRASSDPEHYAVNVRGYPYKTYQRAESQFIVDNPLPEGDKGISSYAGIELLFHISGKPMVAFPVALDKVNVPDRASEPPSTTLLSEDRRKKRRHTDRDADHHDHSDDDQQSRKRRRHDDYERFAHSETDSFPGGRRGNVTGGPFRQMLRTRDTRAAGPTGQRRPTESAKRSRWDDKTRISHRDELSNVRQDISSGRWAPQPRPEVSCGPTGSSHDSKNRPSTFAEIPTRRDGYQESDEDPHRTPRERKARSLARRMRETSPRTSAADQEENSPRTIGAADQGKTSPRTTSSEDKEETSPRTTSSGELEETSPSISSGDQEETSPVTTTERLYNLLMTMDNFAKIHGMTNPNTKDENMGCHLCLGIGTDLNHEFPHTSLPVHGYVRPTGPRLYHLCPRDLRSSWLENFKAWDGKLYT